MFVPESREILLDLRGIHDQTVFARPDGNYTSLYGGVLQLGPVRCEQRSRKFQTIAETLEFAGMTRHGV